MTERPARRWAHSVALACLLVVLLSGCSVLTGQNPRTGNSPEENMDLADQVFDQVLEEFPDTTGRVTYKDNITSPASMTMSVALTDPAAALVVVEGFEVPAGSVFAEDPTQVYAPIAARIAQIVWESDIDPLGGFRITVTSVDADGVPAGDGEGWDASMTGGYNAEAYEESYGARP